MFLTVSLQIPLEQFQTYCYNMIFIFVKKFFA